MASISSHLPVSTDTQQAALNELQTVVQVLDVTADAIERVQQQLGQLTGINLERNERVE